jgi:hypothetical protein
MEQIRISDAATLVDAGVEGGNTAFVCYDVLGWYVELRCGIFLPGGPQSINVSTPDGIPIDGGVTTSVLRAVPLADARKRLDRLREDHVKQAAAGDLVTFGGLVRVDSEEGLARFAKTYADLVESGDDHPLKRLATYTGLSRNTLSARVRRARERGLLTKPSPESLGALTKKAEQLLQEGTGPSRPARDDDTKEARTDA